PATQRLRGMGGFDASYQQLVRRWTATAVTLAARRLRPATVAFGTAEAAIGINRRERRPDGRIILGDNPAGACDPTVAVLRVAELDGRPLALWFSHATHPVIMGGENTTISAEFPGQAARDLAAVLDGATALFAQGCCGDVNPVRRGSFAE